LSGAILSAIAKYGPAIVIAILAGWTEWRRRKAKRAEKAVCRDLGIAENAISILTTAIEAGQAALPRKERKVKRIVEKMTRHSTLYPEKWIIEKAISEIDDGIALKEAEAWLRKMHQ